MRRPFALAVCLLAASTGCGLPACRYGGEDAKTMTRDPEQLHAYFVDQVRCGQWAQAYENGLSEETQRRLGPYVGGTFYFIMQWEIVRRLVAGFEQHAVKVDKEVNVAVVRWCNREFGVSRDYRMVGEKIGRTKIFWRLDLTQDQLVELKDAAFAWLRKQQEVSDGRRYAYPADWRFAPVGARCGCAT